MKNFLYVVGGHRREGGVRDRDPARLFRKAMIVRVDPDTGESKTCVEYVSPPDACAEDPAILFKAGTVHGDRLYVCTLTEVLTYSFPAFELVGYLSLPLFNDLHHVRPTPEGNLLVVSTGLDMVVEVTPDGEVLREWNVLGEDPWERFSRDVDYRKVTSTKPHHSHPNYVFRLNGEVWVTRFEQKDAVCLDHPQEIIEIDVQHPHDGIVHEGLVYFTTVDGHVVVADGDHRRVEKVVDLNGIHERNGALGWCRGLTVDRGEVWVGFSRLRPTRFRKNLSWVRHGFLGGGKAGVYNTAPTRVACYDLQKKTCLKEIDLEPAGLNSIFSIFTGPA